MRQRKHFPNAGRTRILQMRINPAGRWYDLHPMDLDLEAFLARNQGCATVRLEVLLLRNRYSPNDTRDYHRVYDTGREAP